MFILPPPPKYYASGATLQGLQSALEASNSLTTFTDDENSFVTPEGKYKALDCVFLATPLPHPSDPPPPAINPLAPTSNLPSTHSSGVRMSVFQIPRNGKQRSASVFSSTTTNSSFAQSPADSYLTANSGSSTANNMNRPRGQSNLSTKSFGWTSSLFNSGKDDDISGSSAGGASNGSTNMNGLNGSNNNGNGNSNGIPIPGSDQLPGQGLRRDSVASSISSSIGSTLSTTLSLGSSVSGSGVGGNGKRIKPKNSLTKNNSSFVSRTIIHEGFNKRLQDRHPDDDVYLWANVGRSISWVASCVQIPQEKPANAKQDKDHKGNDLNMTHKHEPMVKILLTKSHPLSHDINHMSLSLNWIDLIIGTSSGDILWVEAISSRYNRINKNGDVTWAAITEIKWLPGSENLFIAGTSDGLLILFDKEREDSGFASQGHMKEQDKFLSTDKFRIIKSYTKNNAANIKQNPVAVYKVSNKIITGITFSPLGDFMAVTSNDGYLRVINLASETLLDIFPSYYGGFLCCEFSYDGLYLATGGQDDMVSIWSLKSKSLVARLQGHSSWVRRVRFDPYCPDQYRLGSVGEDGDVLLWDFSPKTLKRPKLQLQRQQQQQQKSLNGARVHQRTVSESSSSTDDDSSELEDSFDLNTHHVNSELHEFVPQSDVPILLPIVKHRVHVSKAEPDSLSDLNFLEKCIIASGKDGRVWTWLRP